MNKSKYLILILLSVALIQCDNSNKPIHIESCSYEELMSESVSSESSNGHKINLELEAKIIANIKKLASIEGRVKASDSIYSNVEKTVKKREVNYKSDFIATHNAIIQILCDIEKQLKDSTLTTDLKLTLLKEKIKLRTEYFNFLLSKTKNNDNLLPYPTDKNSQSVNPVRSPTSSLSTTKSNNLKITLRDIDTNLPINGASIAVNGFNNVIVTNGNGEFLIPQEVVDKYGAINMVNVHIAKEGFTQDINIALSESYTIKLKKIE